MQSLNVSLWQARLNDTSRAGNTTENTTYVSVGHWISSGFIHKF
jgi:hypothetical protein